MGMFDFLKKAPTKDASVETGGLRDMYMRHIEEAAIRGMKPLAFPDFIKLMEQQRLQQQMPPQNPPQQGGMMFGRPQ